MNFFQRIFQPESSDVIDSLIGEYLRSLDDGAEIDRQSFIAEYPLHAVELHERMEIDTRVREAERRRSVAAPVRRPPPVNDAGSNLALLDPAPKQTVQVSELTLDRYEIVREVGRGAMGRVFQAWDRNEQRHVAIKTLHAGMDVPASQLRRLAREGTAQQGLRHPNIVEIYDSGIEDNVPYLVMEFVTDGTTLDSLMEEEAKPFAERRAAEIILAVAHALVYSHLNNVVHRDIKPSNILIAAGVPKLSDFGLAFVKRSNLTRLTQSGEILGTLCYMAPEQLQSGEPGADPHPNPRSDLYSLGVTLFELLTGRLPFEGATPGILIRQILEDDPPPPAAFGVTLTPAIEAICIRCMERSLEKRYYSASELADDLTRFIDGKAVNAPTVNWRMRRLRKAMTRRRMYVVTSVLVLIVISLVVWFGVHVRQTQQLTVLRDQHGALPDNGVDYSARILLQAARRGDMDTRVAAFIAMARRSEDALQQALLTAADDPNPQVRFHLANALMNAPTPVAVDVCRKLLQTSDGYVAACAVKLAENLHQPALAADVARFAGAAEPVLRNYAIDAMLHLTGKNNGEFVGSQLQSGTEAARTQLLARLAEGAAPAPIPVLIDALGQPSLLADRETILNILTFFTGQQFGFDIIRWEIWWQASQHAWHTRKCMEVVWASSKSVLLARDVLWAINGRPLDEFKRHALEQGGRLTVLRDGTVMEIDGVIGDFKPHRFYIGTIDGKPVGANDFVARLATALEIDGE